MDNQEMEQKELNLEELETVAGGSYKHVTLLDINHCHAPKGNCKKSKREDKKHRWCSYHHVYVCEYCEQWAYPSEL